MIKIVKYIQLTKRRAKGLMCDDSRLCWVSDIKPLICKESLSIVDIVLQMCDTFFYLAFALHNRFTHLLCHECRISMLVLPQDTLEVAQLLKAPMQARSSLQVLVAESLIGTF